MSGVLDMARHITFNGKTDTYYGLVMSGNTPLLVPTPKQSSVSVSYSHGTIDTSEVDGQIYWNDLNIAYTFACLIPILHNGVIRSTDEMNVLCDIKAKEVDEWLYSGPATLEDTGWSFILYNAECQNIAVTKVCEDTHWIIKFEVTFVAPFNLTITRPSIESNIRKGRFILYNGGASYQYGLLMVGNTPLTTEEPKISSVDWTHKNGVLNLSHCRNGLTSGKDSLFFKDRTITYSFYKSFPRYNGQDQAISTWKMNESVQDFILKMCCWLYDHTGNSFVSIDGNVTYGGLSIMLADSAWLNSTTIPSGGSVQCRILPSARVSGLTFTKTIFADSWGLTMEVTFTTYPVFSNGSIYFPAPQEPTPTPGIIVTPWKHYADFDGFDGDETLIPWFQRINGGGFSGNVADGIYLAYKEQIRTFNGSGYQELVGGQRPVGYVVSGSSISFGDYVSGGNRIDISLDEFIHKSMEDYDNENYLAPRMIVHVPMVLRLTINNHEHIFLPIVSAGGIQTSNLTQLMYMAVHRKLVDGEVVESVTYNTFGYVCSETNQSGGFDAGITILYSHLNETGFAQNIGEPMAAFCGYDIDIPIKANYIQRISENDVTDAYGLYAVDDANAPQNFKVFPYEIVFDYTGEELEIYYRHSDTCKTVNNEPGHTIHGPEYYRQLITAQGFPGAVAIAIPIIGGEANEFVLCDGTKPPKGGDIQWLV